jgi:hypothetical protein
MNKQLKARLRALEGSANDAAMPVIVVNFVEADGTRPEAEAYEDRRGNVWRREPDEDTEAFCDRAAAAALKASPPRCGAVIFAY